MTTAPTSTSERIENLDTVRGIATTPVPLGYLELITRWTKQIATQPTPLAAFVAAVWVLQLWWSTAWLERFRFGPAEWTWRCLTYRTIQ